MALYAIGDIHGMLDALKSIFEKGDFSTDDTFVFLGDYVDRGPDSCGTIDWLIQNSQNYRFVFLKGNHELMMLAAREAPDQLSYWLFFGGAETLDSYGIGDQPDWIEHIPLAHWKFMEEALPYYQEGEYIFVHAGLEAGKPLEEQNHNTLFWKKFEVPEAYITGKEVICGHTSRKNGEIADFGHTVCIDTYAYGGMWLTCLNVETGEFIKANGSGKTQNGRVI